MGEIAKSAGITTTAEMVFGFTDFETEWKMHDEAVNDPAFPRLRMNQHEIETKFNPLLKTADQAVNACFTRT